MADEDFLPDLKQMSARKRAQMTYMMDVAWRIEWDLHNAINERGFIPEAWHEIARATPRGKRRKVTMSIDEDVIRFFREMGIGHLGRMAEVLKTYMHARLAGLVNGAETLNHYKRRETYHAGARPAFGENARILGEDWEDAPDPLASFSLAELAAAIRARLEARKG
ncbi:MAG: BrnA antitoxin family protein [Paracoccaceae bacterium]